MGCTLNWAAEKGGPEGCPFVQPIPPFSVARPFVQCTGPLKIHVFHLETRPSSPSGPPALQLVLSQAVIITKTQDAKMGGEPQTTGMADLTHI